LSDDLCSPVVPIQTWFGDNHANFSIHLFLRECGE
jgi:hypothetical protein